MPVVVYHKRRLYKRFWKKLPSHRWLHAKSYVPRRYIIFSAGKFSTFKRRTPRKRYFKRIADPTQFLRSIHFPKFNTRRSEEKYEKPKYRIKSSQLVKSVKSGKKSKGARATRKKKPKTLEYEDFRDLWKTKKYLHGFRERYASEYNFKYTEEIRAARGKLTNFGNVSYDGKNWKSNHGGWERVLKVDPTTGKLKNPRKYKNYGTLGHFDDTTIFSMHLKLQEYMNFLQAMRNMGVNTEEIKKKIKSATDSLRQTIINEGIKWIKTYVPIDTGDLQKSMIDSLKEERSLPTHILIKIGTPNIYYAKVVNRYPEDKVQHFGDVKSWRTGLPLYDPDATSPFFDRALKELRYIARKEFKKFINEIFKSATVVRYRSSGFLPPTEPMVSKRISSIEHKWIYPGGLDRKTYQEYLDEVSLLHEQETGKKLTKYQAEMHVVSKLKRKTIERPANVDEYLEAVEDIKRESKLRTLWAKRVKQDPIKAIIEPNILMIRSIWEVKYK